MGGKRRKKTEECFELRSFFKNLEVFGELRERGHVPRGKTIHWGLPLDSEIENKLSEADMYM